MSEAAAIDDRTLAVITAAVTAYIAGEEEAVAEALMPRPAVPEAPVRLWALSGRQAQMAQRTAMQMRTYR
jgi:hypothetical protein